MTERQWPPDLETKSLTAGGALTDIVNVVHDNPGAVALGVGMTAQAVRGAVGHVADAYARVHEAREETRRAEVQAQSGRPGVAS
jgi:hypothetical protein